MTVSSFPLPSTDKRKLEEGTVFTPRFDSAGLITAIVTDMRDNHLLMVAHMNAAALELTMKTGIAHYWSRSRQSLWKKGETSGNLQHVREMRVDCDQDAIWLRVEVEGNGPACHTDRRSCFFRIVDNSGEATRLVADL